jgi:tetratricopeptide (TPR) repeat protein
MSNIALRAYNREIENQIDNNQLEEAVAHCRHILITYPKHLETYRLLAKAYLEIQKYTDALDILQRVLSVSPDDFIAHIGMSIVRENENNVDAAIWHMERAFDIQPSNNAVQDELKRLIGRKEGIEPAKIRLTRGALVRMYLRGNLFTQAIAEARAALAEDPTRMDLQVVLARALNLAGLKAEAVELAKKMLASLPFCMESHRILIANTALISVEETAASRKKLIELDPYYEFISANIPTIEQIPDNSVLIEKLDWQEEGNGFFESRYPEPETVYTPPQEISSTEVLDNTIPEFTEDSFMNLEKETTSTIESGEPIVQDNAFPEGNSSDERTFEESLEPDNIMPEWMSSAGWQPGKSEETEAAGPFDSSSEEFEEIAPAELPDWLKSMAPVEEKTPDITQNEPAHEPSVSDFDFLTPESVETMGEPFIASSEEKDLPDWLKSMAPAEENTPDVSDVESTQQTPVRSEEPLSAMSEESDLPDWLKSLTSAEENLPEVPEIEPALEEPVSELSFSDEELTPEPEQPNKGPNDDLPDWLRTALEEDESSEITQKISPPKPSDTIPGWVQETEKESISGPDLDILSTSENIEEQKLEPMGTETPHPSTWEPVPENREFLSEMGSQESPDTLETQNESIDQLFRRELESSEEDIPAFNEPVEQVTEEAPVFFEGIETEESISGKELDETVIAEEAEKGSSPLDLPDWLKGLDEIPEEEEQITQELSLEDFSTTPSQEVAEIEAEEIKEEIKPVRFIEEEEKVVETAGEPLPIVETAPVIEPETLESTLQKISKQIQQKQNLEDVINSLTQLTQDHPDDVLVWQLLGDAYFKNNQIQQAIDAYAKAEEVLK